MVLSELGEVIAQITDWEAIAFTAFYLLLGAAAGAHALLNKPEPRAAQVWLIICLFLPIIGLMAYYAFGVNRFQTRAKRLHEPIRRNLTDAQDLSIDTLRKHGPYLVIGNRVADMPAHDGNNIDILFNGDDAYPAMLAAISGAKRRVLLCSYIFDNDATGQRFVAALKSAEERGVEVRVLVDAIGECYSWPRISRALKQAEVTHK